MNTPDDARVNRCRSAIRDFASAIRPTLYSRDGVAGNELLEAERRLNECWTDFEGLTEHGWGMVREQMSRSEESYLWYYAIHMAEMAVRLHDEDFIRYGLMALVAMDISSDPRDIYTGLALLMDAAKRVDANVRRIFGRAAELGSPEMQRTIDEYFKERSGETSMDHVLRGLGWTVTGSGHTFKYRSADNW